MIPFDLRFLHAWSALTQRFAAVIVLVAVLLTVVAGGYVAGHLKINTDTSDMLSPDLPFRRLSRVLDAAFPQFSDTIVVVIDGAIPERVDQAALQLADRLRRQPEVFGMVQDLAGEPFFRRHGLLYMDTAELETLSDRLARAQPFLTTLYADMSLKGLAKMLSSALGPEGGAAGRAAAAPILRQMAAVVEAVVEGRFARLSWERMLQGRDDAVPARRILLIQPALDFGTLHPARRAMDALRALAIDLDLTPAHGLRVRLTGSVALAEEELASVETGMGLANGAALVLVGVLLVVGLRAVRLVVPVLITLAMGLVWTAALALVMVGSLNLISVAFAVLFIGLGVDFGIHFSLRYREGRERHPDAIGWAAANVGGPLALSAGGAGIGFFSFLPTPYQGFAELGLIVGVGMFIALMANLTVLPALLTLMPLPVPSSPSPRVRSVMAWSLRRLMVRRARLLAWGSVLLAAAAMTALPAARFDLDPLNLKDSGTESVSTVRELMKDERHGPHGIVILADSPAQARDLAERLGRLPTVASVATLFDYVPHDQDEKLHMIGDMALFLSPLFASHHRMEEPDPAETRQALTDLMQTLATFADPHAQALLEALRRIPWEEPAAVRALETALLATLPQRLEALRDALQAGPVTLADLPPALRAREMTADGRTRVEIHPREDITDRAALGRFVETVRTLAPQATGTPVSLYESGQAVLYSFHLATGITVLALLVLLTVLLRRARDVLLAFAPLVLAALLTNALAVMIGLPYNFANIIALPLLFGIGIANGIQFVFRERLEGGALAVLDTTTPRAVVLSALTTVVSFGSLALSTHPGTASMGLLLGIAITVTLLVTLFVLPALMLTLPRRAPS